MAIETSGKRRQALTCSGSLDCGMSFCLQLCKIGDAVCGPSKPSTDLGCSTKRVL